MGICISSVDHEHYYKTELYRVLDKLLVNINNDKKRNEMLLTINNAFNNIYDFMQFIKILCREEFNVARRFTCYDNAHGNFAIIKINHIYLPLYTISGHFDDSWNIAVVDTRYTDTYNYRDCEYIVYFNECRYKVYKKAKIYSKNMVQQLSEFYQLFNYIMKFYHMEHNEKCNCDICSKGDNLKYAKENSKTYAIFSNDFMFNLKFPDHYIYSIDNNMRDYLKSKKIPLSIINILIEYFTIEINKRSDKVKDFLIQIIDKLYENRDNFIRSRLHTQENE